MKLEIINPSDKCFLETDDIEAAAFATMMNGQGRYALRGEDGNDYCPIMLFGRTLEFLDNWWDETFGRKFSEYRLETAEDYERLANVCATFHYETERSSMNDIQLAFKVMEKTSRRKAKELREGASE